jgi:polyamine oxidase
VSLRGRGINMNLTEDLGFLHGAYFEGLAIAKLIAGCVKGGSCVDMEHFPQITNAQPYENN